MTFHEFAVLMLFITCVLLWFFRDPQFMPGIINNKSSTFNLFSYCITTGWANYITAVQVDDSTAVMAIMILLFSIPAQPRFWCLRPRGGDLFYTRSKFDSIL